MSVCEFSKMELMAWLDDEAGKRAPKIREHLEHCRACANEVDNWRRAGLELRAIVDNAVGETDPLAALRQIRSRIVAAEERTLRSRLRTRWEELWLFHRRAIAGVAVAAAVGALSAPGLLYWIGSTTTSLHGPLTASVVVESLEVGGNSTAVVLSADAGSATTLIWVEQRANEEQTEESF